MGRWSLSRHGGEQHHLENKHPIKLLLNRALFLQAAGKSCNNRRHKRNLMLVDKQLKTSPFYSALPFKFLANWIASFPASPESQKSSTTLQLLYCTNCQFSEQGEQEVLAMSSSRTIQKWDIFPNSLPHTPCGLPMCLDVVSKLLL